MTLRDLPYRRVVFLCVLAIFVGVGRADAAWTVIGTVPPLPNGQARPLSCGFFFDARHGLVGSGHGFVSNAYSSPPPAIFYCRDGVNWIQSNHPRGTQGAEVTSIVMVDTLVGYATLLNDRGGDTYGLWTTSDGGLTWVADPTVQQTATQVYIAPNGTRHLVMFRGAQGVNFSGLSVAWMDSATGVITGSGTNNLPRGTQSTTNGGASWSQVNPSYQSWGIFASPRSRTYFIAPEETNEFTDGGAVLSFDNGATWRQSGTWPRDQYGYWKPTGDVRGGRNAVYVQSAVQLQNGHSYPGPRGLCRSTDNGFTWVNIGGPSNSLDTRFTTAGCRGAIVIAYDMQGNIWSSDDGGDGKLHEDAARPWLTATARQLTASLCGETRGGVRVWNDHCDAMRIDSIIIEDSLLTATAALTFDTIPQLPRTFLTDASDTIDMRWQPRLAYNHDTTVWTTVRIRYYSSTTRVSRDTTLRLQLIVKGEQARYAVSADTIDAGNASICSAVDTTVAITNNGCDTLTIERAAVSGFWSVRTALPLTLAPAAVGAIQVHHQGAPLGASADSLTVGLLFQGHRDTTSVALRITSVHGTSTAAWSARTADFGGRSLCAGPDSTVITLRNTGCDTLTVVTAGAWSNLLFRWTMPPAPQMILPGATAFFGIALTPLASGAAAGMSIVSLRHADGTMEADTIRALCTVNDSGRYVCAVGHNTMQFGRRTVCALPDTQWFTLRNAGCDLLSLDAFDAWRDPVFRYIQAPVTGTLIPGASVQIGVEFSALSPGAHADAVTVRVRFGDGSVEIDTIAAFAAVTDSGRYALQVNTPAIAYGSIAPCSQRDSVIILTNVGCDTLTVDSASISNTAFTVDPRVFPIVIPPGGAGSLTVTYHPDIPGSNTATMRLTGSDTALHEVALSGSSRGPVTMLLKIDGTLDMLEPGTTRWLWLRLIGPPPEAALSTIEARVQFDPEMFHPSGAQASQGLLRSFRHSGDSATVVIDLMGTPDTARAIAGIEFLGLSTQHDSSMIMITRADFGVSSLNPATCYLTAQLAGTSGGISLCGPSGKVNVKYAGMALTSYPNPAQNWVTMQTRASGAGNVEITDMLGRTVARFAVTTGDALNTIPTEGWQAGVYGAVLRVGTVELRRIVNVVR